MSEKRVEFRREIPGGEEINTYYIGQPELKLSDPDKMDEVLENLERERATLPFSDENGRVLGEVDFNPETGDIIGIRTQFSGPSKGAESPEEHIYITGDNGQILPERATRAQARERGQCYLIVTTLIFHGKEMLFQRRSPEKTIDPGMLSSSSHGVAKELYLEGKRIESLGTAALLTTAVETNEELKHSADAKPFTFKIWPGTVVELRNWAAAHKVEDPNSVYLIPEILPGREAYPLLSEEFPRSRALLSGFVLGRQEPEIIFDPNETSSIEWRRTSEVKDELDVSIDTQRCIEAIYDLWLSRDPAARRPIADRLAKISLKDSLTLK